jgi:hypothetical protein
LPKTARASLARNVLFKSSFVNPLGLLVNKKFHYDEQTVKKH